jgi:ADP-ribose pyrophosphatase
MTEESAALIYCTCEGEISTDYLEDDEDIEPILVDKEEAKKLLESDAKLDVKAFLTLQSFVILGEELFNIR